MTLMDVHIFVASGVYAFAIVYVLWLMIEIPVYLSDPRNRAMLKKRIRRTIRNILKLFVKADP